VNRLIYAMALWAAFLVACKTPGDSSSNQPEASTSATASTVVEPDPIVPPQGLLPPPAPDPRSPLERAQAACAGADGKWKCRHVAQPQVMALSSSSSPIIPASWTVPAWVVDGANLSGTASDFNDCTTITTPCLTYQEINVHRWGCGGNPAQCPRLRQSTTVEFMSSQSAGSDLVYFNPTIENGAVVQIFGPLGAAQQIASGVLSNVTPKNRATPQLLLAQSGATAVGQLVINATHPSRAWTYVVSSGSIFKMTQPLVAAVVPAFAPTATEVDTWANGDAVTVYQPVSVNIARVVGTFVDYNGGFSNPNIYLYNINAAGAAPLANANVSGVSWIESSATTIINNLPITDTFGTGSPRHINNFFQRFGVAGSGTGIVQFFGGAGTLSLIGTVVDYDAILSGGGSVTVSTFGAGYGEVYVETGRTLDFFNGSIGVVPVSASRIIWGPGVIELDGTVRVAYPGGAGAAAAAFRNTGGFSVINGLSVTCLGVPSVALPTLTCNLTLSAATLDANLGNINGCLYVPGGASVCNVGH
jgi:hypothetical protein